MRIRRAIRKVNSAKGIAYLYLNEEEVGSLRLTSTTAWQNWELDPNDAEPYYSVGVIDWSACYQPRMEERAKLGMKPDEHLRRKE